MLTAGLLAEILSQCRFPGRPHTGWRIGHGWSRTAAPSAPTCTAPPLGRAPLRSGHSVPVPVGQVGVALRSSEGPFREWASKLAKRGSTVYVEGGPARVQVARQAQGRIPAQNRRWWAAVRPYAAAKARCES